MKIKIVEIELNSNCNRSCSYCPNSIEMRKESGVIKWEMFEQIVHQLNIIQFKGKISYSFYNEPLLIPNIEEYNKYIKHNLPEAKIVIYTNGTLLNETKFYSLVESGVSKLIVTKHEADYNKNYKFDNLIKSLPEKLVSDYIIFKKHTDLTKTNRGGLLPSIQKNIDATNLPCLIPLNMITITNQGTILPCFEDYRQVNAMGSLTVDKLWEIWNTPKYDQFRKKLLLGKRSDYEVCQTCNRTDSLGIK